MYRNFDQIRDDARAWLRVSSRPIPSIRNEVNYYGFIRRAHIIIDEPTEHVAAVEVNRPLTGRRVGALALQPDEEAGLAPVLFQWNENVYTVMSELTYNPSKPVRLNQLSGVILDAIYDRIAPVMNEINLYRITNILK